MPLIIRPLKESDLGNCIKLFQGTVHAINAKDYTQAQRQAWAPEHIDIHHPRWQSLLTNITFIAEMDNELLGFIDMTHKGYLDRAFVHKHHQSKGIASALFSAIEKEALRLGITEIFTEASITAKPHAEAKGFILYQEQKKLHNGVEFINYIMKKSLFNPSKLDIKFLADCEEHIPAIAKLWYEEISQHWAPNPSIERAIQNLKNHSNKDKLPIAYVALYDSKPVGLACLRDNDGIREGTGPWLGSLVVCPHHRGHHIGETLINAIKQKAIDLNFHELYLLAFDPTIPQWYTKLGWSSIGEDQLFGHRVEVMKIKL